VSFKSATVKHPVHGNGCRLEGKNPKLDGTASRTPPRLIDLPEEEEEDKRLELDSSWCIDHGIPLPEREEY